MSTRQLILSAVIMSILVTTANRSDADATFRFINVGHGDGTLITCPNDEQILIDFGSLKNGLDAKGNEEDGKALAKRVAGYIESPLEYLMITHGDEDHYNRVDQLVDAGVEVTTLFLGGLSDDYSNWMYEEYLINESKAKTKFIYKDDDDEVSVNLDQPAISCGEGNETLNLYIVANNFYSGKDVNKHGMVIVANYQTGKEAAQVWIMGDASKGVENKIWYNINNLVKKDSENPNNIEREVNPKEVDFRLLRVGHHGSDSSTKTNFVGWLEPQASVISVRRCKNWCHLSKSVFNRLKAAITTEGIEHLQPYVGTYDLNTAALIKEPIYSTTMVRETEDPNADTINLRIDEYTTKRGKVEYFGRDIVLILGNTSSNNPRTDNEEWQEVYSTEHGLATIYFD